MLRQVTIHSEDICQPNFFSLQKSNPGSPFVSAHEGQIALIAKFPGAASFDRAKIEDIIVDLLAVDGAVYAYQKQLATEIGTVRMIVEFCDVGSAHRAVARLNGSTVRVSQHAIPLCLPL